MIRLHDRCQDHDNNFSLLRVGAAYFVLFAHSFGLLALTKGPYAWMFSVGEMAVNLFFAISGFLILQSYVRQGHLLRYLRARLLRLMPALIAAVVLGAFVIGPLMTTWTLADYFRADTTWEYVYKNILLTKTLYDLPGVFEHNPYTAAMNGSLWTLRFELKMYAIAALIGCVGALRTPWKFHLFAAGYMVWYVLVTLYPREFGIAPNDPFVRISVYFFMGAVMQMHARHVPLHWGLGLLTLAWAWLWRDTAADAFFTALAATYWLLYLAYVPGGWIRRYNRFGDFSYGTYVYAFPVQQMWIALWPGIGPWQVLALTVPVVATLAWLSWHGLEKPALDYNKALLRRERAQAAAAAGVIPPAPAAR